MEGLALIDAHIAGEGHRFGGIIEHAAIGEHLDTGLGPQLHVALDFKSLVLAEIAPAIGPQCHAGVGGRIYGTP